MPQRNHEHLFDVAKRMPTDFEPHGQRPSISSGLTQPDCSCNCRFFRRLAGGAGLDWGVCVNPRSPRAGLLTFERFGCPHIEQQSSDQDDDPGSEHTITGADVKW
jgi:hypothetical protein